jgi:alpha-L-fucosidase
VTDGGFTDGVRREYTPADIRFTTKGNALYAITLARPDGAIQIQSLALGKFDAARIQSINLLNGEELEWVQNAEALSVVVPSSSVEQVVVKILLGA